MISKIIRNSIINAKSDLVSMKSLNIIMAMVQHYVPEEHMVKGEGGGLVHPMHLYTLARVYRVHRVHRVCRVHAPPQELA